MLRTIHEESDLYTLALDGASDLHIQDTSNNPTITSVYHGAFCLVLTPECTKVRGRGTNRASILRVRA
jgi:hypothetical protein